MKEKFKSLFGNLNKSYSHFEGKTPKKNGTLKAFIIILIFFLIAEYFTLTPINLRSPDFVFFLAFCIILFIGLRSLFQLSFDKINRTE